jgi:heat shock protein HslJ
MHNTLSVAARLALVILALTALMLACQQPKPTSPPGAAPIATPAAAPAALRGTDWTCTWIAVDGRTMTPDALEAPTLRIDPPANASGRGGVNRFGGSAELSAVEPGATGTIGFPAIAATKMAGPPERMELEGAYFAALRAARRYEIKGDELTLHGDAGAVATFKAAPKAD